MAHIGIVMASAAGLFRCRVLRKDLRDPTLSRATSMRRPADRPRAHELLDQLGALEDVHHRQRGTDGTILAGVPDRTPRG